MKKILVVALAIAVIIGIMWIMKPLWIMKPWEILPKAGEEEGLQEGGETWTPPENLSGDLVAFHFTSSFTYEKSEGNQILENFDVILPWPHYPSTYRPMGRDETREGFVPAGVPDNRLAYDPEVYGFGRPEVWSTEGDKSQIRTRCALYYHDRLEAENGNPIQALGTRTKPPTIRFKFGDPYIEENILNKVLIYVNPDLRAGETVMIEGGIHGAQGKRTSNHDRGTRASSWSKNHWARGGERAAVRNALEPSYSQDLDYRYRAY